MEKSIKERVVELVVRQLDVKREIRLEDSFIEDLGADSLDSVELMITFSDEFGIEIPDEDAEKITTIGEAVNYIKEAKSHPK